ncbi:MAG TPA: tetratricopeptide repeat protein, partial [Myxococcales bacterium]|nr:tetratricopeptide repeat protein [Myxococcales bacterium]
MARPGKSSEDEFLHALYQGGELLAAGRVIEAKDHLERAYQLQPDNEKGQNLLGLTYFKLGLFDRAAEIYERLVEENPGDPTLRVNLGLVYLKTNVVARAVREFEAAVDLAPEHKRAHNYLGIALAQAGELGRARDHFLVAGSDQMAEKMTRAIAGEGFGGTGTPAAEGAEDAGAEAAPMPEQVNGTEHPFVHRGESAEEYQAEAYGEAPPPDEGADAAAGAGASYDA